MNTRLDISSTANIIVNRFLSLWNEPAESSESAETATKEAFWHTKGIQCSVPPSR